MVAFQSIAIPCQRCGTPFLASPSRIRRGIRFCSHACSYASRKAVSMEQRFWSKVVKGDGCWEWSGPFDSRKYGVLSGRRGQRFKAHRYSWQLHFGDPGGLCVLHRCDNPSCVRPDHLFLGTQIDNIADMNRKGRHGTITEQPLHRGELNRRNKYSETSIRRAKAMLAEGARRKDIAAETGVSMNVIASVACGRLWKHL